MPKTETIEVLQHIYTNIYAGVPIVFKAEDTYYTFDFKIDTFLQEKNESNTTLYFSFRFLDLKKYLLVRNKSFKFISLDTSDLIKYLRQIRVSSDKEK